MAYVILDPAGEYPAAMIEFLGGTGRGAIAVFTNEGQYHAYKHMMADRLGPYMVDGYLMSEWDDIRAMAWDILTKWNGQIEGIIPWCESSIETGAILGELLGTGWNDHEVIHRFRNKFAMKDRLRAFGDVRVNDSLVVTTQEEAEYFLRHMHEWPVVVKPTSGSGSSGVSFAWSWEELMEGCQSALASGSGEVLLEEYVGGTEFVINGIVDAYSDLLITSIWMYDKRSSHGHHNLYYDAHKVSTHQSVFWPLAEYAGRVVERLGLRRAPIHMEVKLDEYGPCLIEVGARFGGGKMPVMETMLHGRSLFELAACHYVAELPVSTSDLDYELYDRRDARVVSGIQPYTIERVSEVHGLETVQQLPSFHSIANLSWPGAYLPATTDMWSRSYEVYLVHDEADQVSHDSDVIRRVLGYS